MKTRRQVLHIAVGLLAPALLEAGMITQSGVRYIVSSGGGTSDLAAAFAALSANSWGTLTVGNEMQGIPSGDGINFIPFSHKMEWDTLHGIGHFFGGEHGSGSDPKYGQRVAAFHEDTSQWTNPADYIPVLIGLCHGYSLGTVDQSNGDVWYTPYNSDTPYVRSYSAGTWSTKTDNPGRYSITPAWQYHPGLFSGAGGFVVGDTSGIQAVTRSGTWSWLYDRHSPLDAMGGYSMDATYCSKDQCVYTGGGADPNGNKLYKVAADGTVTRIADAPVQVNHAAGGSVLLVGSGNAANNLCLINLGTGNIYEYVASTDMWSSVIGTLPTALTSALDSDDLVAFCRVPNYNGIIAFTSPSQGYGNFVTAAHLWKR